MKKLCGYIMIIGMLILFTIQILMFLELFPPTLLMAIEIVDGIIILIALIIFLRIEKKHTEKKWSQLNDNIKHLKDDFDE